MKQRNEQELKVVEFFTDHLRGMKAVDKRIEMNDMFIDAFRGVLEGQTKKSLSLPSTRTERRCSVSGAG